MALYTVKRPTQWYPRKRLPARRTASLNRRKASRACIRGRETRRPCPPGALPAAGFCPLRSAGAALPPGGRGGPAQRAACRARPRAGPSHRCSFPPLPPAPASHVGRPGLFPLPACVPRDANPRAASADLHVLWA